MMDEARRPLRTLLVLFFFSGFSSLIIETVFCRLLTYTFGNTAQAVSTVLAAFLGGLALGAYVIGRWADRRQASVWFYGGLELGVAIYAAFIPKIFSLLTTIYVSLNHQFDFGPKQLTLVRFSLAALVVVAPSFLMGGTLPVLSRIVAARDPKFTEEVDRLYGYNTLGAAAGTLLSTFMFMPYLGLVGAIAVACGINVLICLVAFTFPLDRPLDAWRQSEEHMPPEDLSESGVEPSRTLILVGAFLTGASALAYEVLWTHIQAFTIGNTVYAFGTMLFVLLCGLGFGAHIVAKRFRRPDQWGSALAWSQGLLGLVVLLTVPVWGLLSVVFVHGYGGALAIDASAAGLVLGIGLLAWSRYGRLSRGLTIVARIIGCLSLASFVPIYRFRIQLFSPLTAGNHATILFFAGELLRFLCAAGMIIIPALLVGVSFPLLLNLFSHPRSAVGSRVGNLYAANTFGAIAGSLLAGFLLIPRFGSQGMLRLSGAFNLLLALLFLVLLVRMPNARKLVLAGGTAVASLLFWAIPGSWNLERMARGSYVYFYPANAPGRLLYLREDTAGGLTSVIQSGEERTMFSNWKFQGNNTTQRADQVRFSLIPNLFTRKTERVLVIGLGTGDTLRSLTLFPFREIDVAELAPHIVDAARLWFGGVNAGVLDSDPRVRLSVTDGRNLLLLSKKKYDLITLEISSIWISGEADLYNREFYELCKARLGPAGVLAQWVQLHHMPTSTLLVLLNTAARVFPHVAFFVGPRQGLLIASDAPLEGDYAQWSRFEADPRIAQELDQLGAPSLASLLGDMVVYDDSFREALAGLPRVAGRNVDFVSTDLFPYLEYATPKGNALNYDTRLANERYLTPFRPALLPLQMTTRNVPSPAELYLIYGYVLERRGEYAAAAEYFSKVQGPAGVRAREGLARIKDRHDPFGGDSRP